MRKACNKDIIRTIKKERKRLLALIIITALGVMMMCGLKAACDDLRVSADRFFDEQQLHDLSIQSTLGLTREDVDALKDLDSIQDAQGSYREEVSVAFGDVNQTVAVNTFTEGGIDCPYVVEGTIPSAANEIAVNRPFLDDSGLSLGDHLTIVEKLDSKEEEPDTTDTEEDEDEELVSVDTSSLEEEPEKPNFIVTDYVITAVVTDVRNITNPDGAASFRGSNEDKYVLFVREEAVDTEIYTSVNVTVTGAAELSAYSDAYEKKIKEASSQIETLIKEKREEARYQSVYEEAAQKIEDAKKIIRDAFRQADQKIADARKELDDGWKELEDGEKELADAEKEIADGEQELIDGEKKLKDSEKKLKDAEQQIADGEKELADGEKELKAGEEKLNREEQSVEQQIANARAEIEAGFAQVADGETQLAAAEEQLNQAYAEVLANEEQLQAGKRELESGQTQLTMAYQELESQKAQLEAVYGMLTGDDPETVAARAQLDAQAEQLEAGFEQLDQQQAFLNQSKEELAANESALGDAKAEIEAGYVQLEEQKKTLAESKEQLVQGEKELNAKEQEAKQQIADARTELEDGKKELEDGRKELEDGKKELKDGRRKLEDGKKELEDGRKELEDGKKELEDGRKELEDGRQELEDGEKEFDENIALYEDKKVEAEDKIADAEAELADIPKAVWYVQDRNSMSSFANSVSDTDCIEAIGTVFPVMFLIIAILISLTTLTRMVEEDRGLIGTYQALGFRNHEIRRKYLIYSGFACVIGGILGNIGGFVVLPKILFVIFDTMYLVPSYEMVYSPLYGFGGILLFAGTIAAAAFLSCGATLREMPASLMRPKPPRSGSRILLERVGFIWKRMSFLNKVTARNLFRYKKRFLMTVFGIAGCTGLLVCGFAIKDTVADLMPKQYNHIIQYDLLVANSGGDDHEEMLEVLERCPVERQLNLEISTVKISFDGDETVSAQMYIAEDTEQLREFMAIEDVDGRDVSIEDGYAYVTTNASRIIGFAEGDHVWIQDMKLTTAEMEVKAILQNYLGNSVFLTRSTYEELFDSFEENAAVVCLADDADEAAVAKVLNAEECIVSVSSTGEMKDTFSQAFKLMNMVVYIVIVLAAGLAFVVLFTLSMTNISERERELASIKVLGFYDSEVHRYVNKETLLLTVIGIFFGMPLGTLLSYGLMVVLRLPSVEFDVSIHPVSYLYAAAFSFVFALAVNGITDRTLNRIDPIEALKSVE